MSDVQTRFLILANMCDEDRESEVLTMSKIGLQTGMLTFSRAIIKSIETATHNTVTIMNSLPLGWFPKYSRKMILKSNHWQHRDNIDTKDYEIGYINLPLVKEFTKLHVAKRKIVEWLDAGEQCNNIILVHGLNYGFIRACTEIKKGRKQLQFCTCIVNGDLPGKYTYTSTGPFWERAGRNSLSDKALKLSRRFDKSILITEGIAEITKPEHGFMILDNITDINQTHISSIEELNHRTVILYTGALLRAYGVLDLLDAFAMIKDDYELWIVGDGELRSEVENRAVKDKRVKYLGFVEKKAVSDIQIKATVLVNPRKSDNGFTRFSFPSKTTEYLASGVPMIGYKLQGMGDEYCHYLNSPMDESNESLAKKIKEICELPIERRYSMGKAAREFIITEKSCLPQGRRIVDYICK